MSMDEPEDTRAMEPLTLWGLAVQFRFQFADLSHPVKKLRTINGADSTAFIKELGTGSIEFQIDVTIIRSCHLRTWLG